MKIEPFKRGFTLREDQAMSAAKIIDLASTVLPEYGLLHYMTDTPANIGIRGSFPLIQADEGDIRLSFIDDGIGDNGRPVKQTFNLGRFIRAYRSSQKRFLVQTKYQRAVAKPLDLAIFDYSALLRMYKYSRVTRFYDEWRNITKAMTTKIDDPVVSRISFITVKMPNVVPSKNEFNKAAKKLSNDLLTTWSSDSQYWLLELWKIMEGTNVNFQVKNMENVYFVLMEGRNGIIVNAANLAERGEAEHAAFYKLLLKLQETRTVADTEAIEDTEEAEVDVKKEVVPGVPNPVIERLVELGDSGKLSVAEQRRFVTIAQNTAKIPNPFGEGTVGEAGKVTEAMLTVNEDLDAPVNKKIVPKSYLKSSVSAMNADYVNKGTMKADILNSITHLNKLGVLVQDIKIEDNIDAVNNAQVIKIKLVPIEGKQSTIAIELPVFEPDGTFIADGSKYILDGQKVDAPIRKAGTDRAVLTSYAGKLFLQRSRLVKNNLNSWVTKNISEAALNSKDMRVTKSVRGGIAIPRVKLPRYYTAAMTMMNSFTSGKNTFNFNYPARFELAIEKEVKRLERNNSVVCGKSKDGALLVMTMDGVVHAHKDGKSTPLGDFMDVIGGNWGKRPIEFAEIMNLKGSRLPIVLALCWKFGLPKVLRMVKAKSRTEPVNVRSTARDYEMAVNFRDERLLIDMRDPEVSLLMGGLNSLDGVVRSYNLSDFSRTSVYGAIMSAIGIEKFQINELRIIFDAWIDPITEEVLQDMKEPTEMHLLLLRCVELLTTDESPSKTNAFYTRERRLERISGFVFDKLLRAVKEQRNKPNPAIHPVYVGPRDVWNDIIKDPTKQLVKELNPTHSLKEVEAVSLSGTGGQSAKTLTKESRVFDADDLGRYSEATPDSGKVGIRTFTPPNPKIKNVRGMQGDKFDFERDGAASVISTNSLVMPAMTNDDPKRMNLGNAQQSAVVPCVGYQEMPLRTGMESVLASRVGDLFAVSAMQDGEVIKVTDSIIRVKYVDGTEKGWELGVYHGSAEGKTIPHTIVTDLTEGHNFLKGHVLAWNTGFFRRDFFSPANVTMLTGSLVRCALLENNDVLEDGSRIGPRVQEVLKTPSSKRKGILVRFDQDVNELVKVGDEVVYDSVLCQISEQAAAGLLEEDAALAALAKLSGSNPKAKIDGKVTKIEVVYNGEVEDMSPSLQKLAKADNKRRKQLKKDLGGRRSETGQIKRATFVSGEKVIPQTAVITIYIDYLLGHGIGDKAVVGNQLKTIHGGTLEGTNTTADGSPIDLLFGYRSENDRIVNSFIVQGSVQTTLKRATKRFATICRTGKSS